MKNNFPIKHRSLALVALAAIVAMPLASCVPPPHHHGGAYRPVGGPARPGEPHRGSLAGPGGYHHSAPVHHGSPGAYFGGPLGPRR